MRTIKSAFQAILGLATIVSTASAQFIPGGAASVGLNNIVPDKIIYDVPGQANLNNWEPNISVLGNSVFLIEVNTFAEPTIDGNQRYGLVFQPVAGGMSTNGDAFFTDEGVAWRNKINDSRQDGNPGRVGGDKRPGAVNIISGGEASAPSNFEFTITNPDTRWGLNLTRVAGSRWGTVQTFSVDPITLVQKTNGLAFDAANGRLQNVTINNSQSTRFGGEVAGLDNGNFVVAVEDRSNVRNAAGNAAVVTIVAPDGSIVTESFLVANGDLWSNLAAYKGGFAVRVAGVIYFYDNAGTPTGSINAATVGGASFDTGRGDGTRIVSHINSPYVFLAGRNNGSPSYVRVAAFDSRTASFVSVTNVNELMAADGGTDSTNLIAPFDRINAASDALNRVTVAYEANLNGFLEVVARVLSFDGTKFSYLTKSFFPFVNHGDATQPASLNTRTHRPSLSMTTKQICIAAKGEINSANNPAAGPDSQVQATFYTVLDHPDAQPDPTCPVTTPASASAVGLAHIVKDKIIYDVPGQANLNNWEPNISVLGNSVFLIEVNTFAEPTIDGNQRYGLVFQPVAGGMSTNGDAFFTDEGVAWRNKINDSRQDGNPGRVGGDKRPGAVNIISGGEASAPSNFEFTITNPDTRWGLNLTRVAGSRWGTVQTFSVDPITLVQKTNGLAFDAANGRLQNVTINNSQSTRFGGEVAGLDNGNFVVAVEDRSNVRNAGGNAAVVTIVAPDGSIVTESFLVANGDLWSNLAAYKGGFAVRVAGVIYFYNNAGTPTGSINAATVGGASFDTGRGDGTRIVSHINSPYVFLAGRNNGDPSYVRVAAFDSRTAGFVSVTNVNELTPANGGSDCTNVIAPFDRINAASDALNRVTVAYEANLNGFLEVVARVLAFDGTKFSYLTHSFFPFVNHGDMTQPASLNTRTHRPSLSMTTKQICIAAKGEINSANNPAAGPDSQVQATFYAVLDHPNPADDPTTSARHLTITRSGGDVILSWEKADGLFTIQRTLSLSPQAWGNLVPQPTISVVGDKYVTSSIPASGIAFFRLIR